MRSIPNQPGRSGFTLIELLIVVLIIAILAAIAVPNFLEFQVRAKVSRAVADMRSVRTCVEAYAVDNDEYPDTEKDMWHPSLLDINRLSTPIAYISTMPMEAFPRMAGSYDPTLYGDGNYYRFYNTKRWESTYPQLEEQSFKWFMMSYGPDVDYSVDDPGGVIAEDLLNGETYMYYDPTNGTVSSGDIINSNKENAS
ncbi:prepilin-type N-terminal cleavage/methylation domain-containing protein [Candidatus Sumerlaeota bacterium]|nr:prepilin-type N-terminal cleavage/methylation domain-containing protein [Candidatus Sumerlaeota bacterium]